MSHSKALIIFLLITFQSIAIAADINTPDPDPGRYAESIDNFLNWDRKNSFPEDAILFVGSSSIRLWKTSAAFPEYPIINRGFGGAHFSDVIYFYDSVIKKYNPQLIVLYVGDNDVAAGKSITQVYNDYLTLVEKIARDLPKTKLIFVPIKPSKSRWQHWENMAAVNQQINSYNSQNANFYNIDLASPLISGFGRPAKKYFLNDQLHLNDAGYEKWNSILAPLLNELYHHP